MASATPPGRGPTGVTVRLATPTDAGDVAKVLHAAFAEFEPLYTPAAFAATCPAPDELAARLDEGPTWVAVDTDGRVVGTVAAVAGADGVYLRSMAVLPSARGRGVGRLLLEQVLAFAALEAAPRTYLCTTPFLAGAIRLYEGAGFVWSDEGPTDLHGTRLFTMVHARDPTDPTDDRAASGRSNPRSGRPNE